MASEKGGRKEKNQNIQVFVRLRPLNQRERDIRSIGVVEVVNGKEVLVKQSQQTNHTKRFTFDRAFGHHAKQVEVYQEVVSPLIEEVLAGYNCTVFAYGQTGTGKTHTMVGENIGDETTWQSDPLAGIIPRSLSQLFDELRLSNTEYTVRVSYLELYNEELFDLLSSSEDNSKLRIYEDITRKGANIVNGLEEITVYNKNEVYKIMAQGQERKRVASTLMNAQSSIQYKERQITQFRSHTVFTIVVHMKENGPDGEELVKIGKLNLVDLAGSENISKAGSDNPAKRERARECVNINQSLLTLGRVITALVERHPHIPYRESKLTRILQESLGGRTKTSIIATISPGHKDLEETMSTLEYANRAKNIQNKPEINQKMTKKAILKEYAEEIDRLKRDLQAARDKNGVYLANETFAEMTLKQEEQRKEIQELLLRKRALEEERDNIETMFNDHQQKLQARESELNNTKNALDSTKIKLTNTSNMLQSMKLQYEEQKHLVEYHQQTESALTAHANEIIAVTDMATSDACSLHDTVDKRKSVEETNLEITAAYRELSSQYRHYITSEVDNFVASLTNTFGEMQSELKTHTADNMRTYADNQNTLGEVISNGTETMKKIAALQRELSARINTNSSEQKATVRATIQEYGAQLQRALEQSRDTIIGTLQNVADMDLKAALEVYLDQWYTSAASHVASVRNGLTSLSSSVSSAAEQRTTAARRQHDARRQYRDRNDAYCREQITLLEKQKVRAIERRNEAVALLEMERTDIELRLTKWIETERRLLEERLEQYLISERNAFQTRYEKSLAQIEEQRRENEERITHDLKRLEAKLRISEEECTASDEDLKENEEAIEECLGNIDNYKQLCDEGIGAVLASAGSLTENLLNVVNQVKTEMDKSVYEAKDVVTVGTNGMISANQQQTEELAAGLAALMDGVVHESERLVNHIVNHVNVNSTSTIEQLSKLVSGTQELLAACRAYQVAQSGSLATAQREQQRFGANLREAVKRQEEIESKCLKEQYKVYSPTGRTPHRNEYRFPRQLPAASPHERVLVRFRAMRCKPSDDDCIVIESDENRTISDCESSCSDESGAFATPLPPTSTTTTAATTPAEHPLIKCTSETDIYTRRRQDQQGKENANRSMSFKKPSKLPAPAPGPTAASALHKRPLLDRNAH